MSDAANEAAALKRWMFDAALPLWWEQGADRVSEDVVEPGTPALRPDMPKRGDDAIGDNRFEILGHSRQGIEADRPLGVGRIQINEIVAAGSRNVHQHRFGEIAMGVEQRQTLAGGEVLRD